ncbi:MAG: hypothetical protein AAF518_06615 [Spirochaetota bacterium]
MTKRFANLNPAISGYLIFVFQKLRNIQFSELLKDHNKAVLDPTIDFYLERLGSFLYHKDLDLHKANRVKEIAKHYTTYQVFYTDTMDSQTESELASIAHSYMLIAHSENIVRGYQQALYDFHRICKNGTYCKIKDTSKILSIHRKYFLYHELGSL